MQSNSLQQFFETNISNDESRNMAMNICQQNCIDDLETLMALTTQDLQQLKFPIGIIKKIEPHLKSGCSTKEIVSLQTKVSKIQPKLEEFLQSLRQKNEKVEQEIKNLQQKLKEKEMENKKLIADIDFLEKNANVILNFSSLNTYALTQRWNEIQTSILNVENILININHEFKDSNPQFTFDPNKKKSNVILQNNNLTCKSSNGLDSFALGNITLKNQEKYYWEIRVDEYQSGYNHAIGIVTTNFQYDTDQLYRCGTNCICLELTNGEVGGLVEKEFEGSWPQIKEKDRIEVYVDLQQDRMCFFLNGKKIHDFKIPHDEYLPAVDIFGDDIRTLIVPSQISQEILNQL